MHNDLKKQLVSKYLDGEDHLYKFLLSYAIEKILETENSNNKIKPEIELLELHDKFLLMYRKDDDSSYLEIARMCRKAAHKIYRVLIKKNLIEKNLKFLNLVE